MEQKPPICEECHNEVSIQTIIYKICVIHLVLRIVVIFRRPRACELLLPLVNALLHWLLFYSMKKSVSSSSRSTQNMFKLDLYYDPSNWHLIYFRKKNWMESGTISTKANTASQSSILSSDQWFEETRHTTASCCYHQQIVPISVSVKKRWKDKECISNI